MNNIKEKGNKNFNKILKEIIIIISYIKTKTIVEINDIKFVFDNNFKDISKNTKLLLIELLLEQKKTQKEKELYEIIIQEEKNYLLNIFNTQKSKENINDFDINDYIKTKNLMIKASEILFKLNNNIKSELIYLIPHLSINLQIIYENYKKSLDNKDSSLFLENFSFLYNSFILRSFYFIIESLIASKSFLNDKQKIFEIYKTILFLDKQNNKNISDFYDLDNIIEIKNPFFVDNNDIESRSYMERRDLIKIPIKMKEEKNLIIKVNCPINKIMNKFIRIELIQTDTKSHIFNLELENDCIFYNIKEIKIEINDISRILRLVDRNQNERIINMLKKNFIINIIPLKNEIGRAHV